MSEPYSVLFSEERILSRVGEIAAEITASYPEGTELYLVAIANGAVIFASDLMRRLQNMVYFDTVKVQSYQDGRSGELRMKTMLNFDPVGKHVIVLDDILDSGKTLEYVRSMIGVMRPASVRTCVLLDKPSGHSPDRKADFSGFLAPDRFVFGYGLDDEKNRYRNLRFIACR